MTTGHDREAPLTPDDVLQILRVCSEDGVLVGGQALALWANHLRVEPPVDLPLVTVDAHFIGDAMLAKKLGDALGWKTWIPSLEEITPQTGKVTHRTKGGGVKQVDFLASVAGLTTKDLVRRSRQIEVPEIGKLRVMHPIDVLDSRIQNLDTLPQKRNAIGIAQARLGVDVVRAFILQEARTGDKRAGLKLVERVAEIAYDIAATRVFLLHGVDPLGAVPLEEFRTVKAFRELRWPQIVAEVARKRSSLEKLLTRQRK